MTGKETCMLLRRSRRRIARNNGIPFPAEDGFCEETDCKGTCAMCQAELQYLKQQLDQKIRSGLPVMLDLRDAKALPFRSTPDKKRIRIT